MSEFAPSEQQGGREGKVCTCVMCAFYRPFEPDVGQRGECRVRGPAIQGNTPYANWPWVSASDWCGDWQSVDLAPERRTA